MGFKSLRALVEMIRFTRKKLMWETTLLYVDHNLSEKDLQLIPVFTFFLVYGLFPFAWLTAWTPAGMDYVYMHLKIRLIPEIGRKLRFETCKWFPYTV